MAYRVPYFTQKDEAKTLKESENGKYKKRIINNLL